MRTTSLTLLALGATLTFLPAQTTWQPFTSITPTPAGRVSFGFAYDSHHRHAILFGGRTFGGTYTNETWRYDGANWTQLSPSTSPPGISSSMMAYDSARQRIVLFGGANSFGFSAQTWEWDGSNWQQRIPNVSPPARNGSAFAYDTVRRRIVMFAGWNGTRMQDTWEYDGATWTQIATASVPSARSDNWMAYDEGRRRMVMYGGYNDVSLFLGDTWEYDGTNWTQVSPTNTAGPLADAGITYDRGRGTIVMFGGKASWSTPNTDQTFEYDGTTWTDLTASVGTPLSARWVAQMVYDEARGRTVAFGGIDNFNLFPGDTRELVTPNVATHRSFGIGCPGQVGRPQLILDGDHLPRPGIGWGLRVQNLPTAAVTLALALVGFSNTTSPIGALPLSLSGLGMPGCTLYVDPQLILSQLASNGAATFVLGLPNQPSVLGIHLFAQGGLLDTTANPTGIVLSDAAEGTIGL